MQFAQLSGCDLVQRMLTELRDKVLVQMLPVFPVGARCTFCLNVAQEGFGGVRQCQGTEWHQAGIVAYSQFPEQPLGFTAGSVRCPGAMLADGDLDVTV